MELFESVEQIVANEKKTKLLSASATKSTEYSSDHDEWFDAQSNDSSVKDKNGSSGLPSTWDTQIRAVQLSRLVWAYCDHWKGSNTYLPGRIADNSEGACEKNVEWPIPPNKLLIEFFSHPRENPALTRYTVVEKDKVRPYDAALNGKKQSRLSFSGSSNTLKMWDACYMNNLREVIIVNEYVLFISLVMNLLFVSLYFLIPEYT